MFRADDPDIRGIHSNDCLIAAVNIVLTPMNELLGTAVIEISIDSGQGAITALEIRPFTGQDPGEQALTKLMIGNSLRGSTLILDDLRWVHPNYNHQLAIEIRGVALIASKPSANKSEPPS